MLQAIFFCKMLPLNRWERRITEISTYISYLTCLYIFCKIEGSELRILREMKKRKKKSLVKWQDSEAATAAAAEAFPRGSQSTLNVFKTRIPSGQAILKKRGVIRVYYTKQHCVFCKNSRTDKHNG